MKQAGLSDLIYALKHPKRILDYLFRERKIVSLCGCSPEDVKGYFEELDRLQLIKSLESDLRKFDQPLGTMLTPRSHL